MGNQIIKQQFDKNIIQLYNLFNKDSLFYQNSDKSFSNLCKHVYDKDLTIQDNKVKILNKKIKKLKKMKLDEYIRDKKIVNEENEICKDHFCKSLTMFDHKELKDLLTDTKKSIFLELKKEFD